MNTSIVGRHIELTDGIKTAIETALESLNKFNLDIISVRAIIDSEEKKGKKGFSVEFSINLAHKNTVVIKQKDKDLYATIDIAIDRAKKVLGKYHEKENDHKVVTLDEIEAQKIVQEELDEANESTDEIVPMELELYKPTEVEDAMTILKGSDRKFIVFYDLDNKLRVMYKRSDGKFGLY